MGTSIPIGAAWQVEYFKEKKMIDNRTIDEKVEKAANWVLVLIAMQVAIEILIKILIQ